MSYRDRLRPNITLTSPDGNVFEALWRGSDRAQEKKLGIFNFPKVDGSIVQDLGVSSATYPMTIIFEGSDNDLESDRFFESLKESGVWQVVHPVHGLKMLQPLSFTPADQPVTSGNVTEIDTEWIEPIQLDAAPSAPELQAATAAQIKEVNSVSSDQFDQSTFTDTAAENGASKSAIESIVASVESHLEVLSDQSATIRAEMEAIKRDINEVLAVIPLDAISLAGQIQELIQLPARAVEDVQARLDAYEAFADEISLSLTPEASRTEDYNTVAAQELALTAVFGAVADISTTGDLISRPQAVQAIGANLELFSDATDTLDTTQEAFEDEFIDVQYFSQSQSYPDSSKLIALTVAYLLRSSFDLKAEKRFVLTRARNFVIVAIEEYGELGEDDSNLDLFIDSNRLEGDEYMIISKGRELVVYV
jgi:hypothetical protein